MENIYRLFFWTEDKDTQEGKWKEIFLDVSKITGFCVTDRDEDMEPAVNIFFEGHVMTIKTENHIKDYLYENFAVKAITEKNYKDQNYAT